MTDIVFTDAVALIVVDMQNDFTDPKGSLFVNGAVQIVTVVNGLIGEARRAGALIVYTQDWHPVLTDHFKKWPVHCVRRTWGAELHPELEVIGPIIRKGVNGEDGYSGFTAHDLTTDRDIPTGLQTLLQEQGIDTVVICGVALDVCVKATVLDACSLGYEVFVPFDATAAVSDTSTVEMEEAGAVIV